MKKYFSKYRPREYAYELIAEHKILKILRKHKITFQIPRQSFCFRTFRGQVLVTSKIGDINSYIFYKKYPDKEILEQFILATRALQQTKTIKDLDLPKAPFPMNAEPILFEKIRHREKLHPDFRYKNEKNLQRIIKVGLKEMTKRDKDTDVLCHGDLCPLNIILNNDGKFAGLVDWGSGSKFDSLFDIAILSWMIRENFGKELEEKYLSAFNLSVREPRITFYRLIYDINLPDYKNWNWLRRKK